MCSYSLCPKLYLRIWSGLVSCQRTDDAGGLLNIFFFITKRVDNHTSPRQIFFINRSRAISKEKRKQKASQGAAPAKAEEWPLERSASDEGLSV